MIEKEMFVNGNKYIPFVTKIANLYVFGNLMIFLVIKFRTLFLASKNSWIN